MTALHCDVSKTVQLFDLHKVCMFRFLCAIIIIIIIAGVPLTGA